MGKIVKYCNSCEEGFAERFGFCPNCGAHLTAFEMNPLGVAEPVSEPVVVAPPVAEPAFPEVLEAAPAVDEIAEPAIAAVDPETPAESVETAAVEASAPETGSFEFDEAVFEEETPAPAVTVQSASASAPEVEAASAVAVAAAPEAVYAATFPQPKADYSDVMDFHVTIVKEKNVRQRNMLLLGFFVLFFSGFWGGVVYSMFNKYLDVTEIEVPELVSYVSDTEPVAFEEEKLEQKDKEKGGGGGGGGKEEQIEANKGRSAAQTQNPLFAPSAYMTKVTDPDIAIRAATENKNDRQADQTDEPYGLPTGGSTLSDGTGRGGGLGSGDGRGQGTGRGSGLGSGDGSGRGGGRGDGEGDGTGGGGDLEGLTVAPKGPTVGVKIISKPRPSYTDSARVNNIQGTVVLRVTFLANGQVGGVSVVRGLSNGLNEQAIAAAKSIRFEPAKRGGVPYSVQKTIEYNFAIF